MEEGNARFDASDEPTGKSVSRGALLTGAGQAVRLGCQIISIIVLSRLLQPEDFGLVAMAAPVAVFVGLFLDLGLMQATIQKQTISHAEINSLFWINIALSVFLSATMVLIAPLVTWFYNEPRVGPLVAAMSLQLLVAGSGAQHFALISRRMEFGRIAALEGAAAVLGLLAAIAWAWIAQDYWALFVGGLTTMSVMNLGSWSTSRWRPSLPRWSGSAGGMVHFGAGITGFDFANYFSRNLDQVLIGRRWGNVELGLYDRAIKLLLFPMQQIIAPLGRVMIPALSRMSSDPARYRRAYLRVAPLLLLLTLPGVAVAIAMADLLIPLALGEQWGGSVIIFQALGFAGLLQPLNSPSGWLYISQGRSSDYLRWGVFSGVTTSAAFFIGLPYGAFGVALAYAASEYLRTPLLWLYVGRRGPIRTRHILHATLPFVTGAHIAVAVLWAVDLHLPGGPATALMSAAVLSYAIVSLTAVLFASGRSALAEVGALVSSRRSPVAT